MNGTRSIPVRIIERQRPDQKGVLPKYGGNLQFPQLRAGCLVLYTERAEKKYVAFGPGNSGKSLGRGGWKR